MKIILSRKGFDQATGGYASPILSDGRMISLPIPMPDSVSYGAIRVEAGQSYYDLMAQKSPRIKYHNKRIPLCPDQGCHLDPDLRDNALDRKSGWRPLFGQQGAAQTHLEKQGVAVGDLFLFFGRFRHHCQAVDFHAFFGYLQIGEIKQRFKPDDLPDWMRYHPHVRYEQEGVSPNALYVSSRHLTWNLRLPGAGAFVFAPDLVLTKTGHRLSQWSLPTFFRNLSISFHSTASWKEDYFQSAARGQEFVVEYNSEVEAWAQNLVERAAHRTLLQRGATEVKSCSIGAAKEESA